MKKQLITMGIIIMAVIVVLQFLGLLSPLLFIIGGVIGIILFLTGMKKEKQKLKEQNIKQPIKQKEKNTKQAPTASSNELDDDLKKVLVMTDSLLGELPQDVIERFSQSDDFELYERVLNKYRIK